MKQYAELVEDFFEIGTTKAFYYARISLVVILCSAAALSGVGFTALFLLSLAIYLVAMASPNFHHVIDVMTLTTVFVAVSYAFGNEILFLISFAIQAVFAAFLVVVKIQNRQS